MKNKGLVFLSVGLLMTLVASGAYLGCSEIENDEVPVTLSLKIPGLESASGPRTPMKAIRDYEMEEMPDVFATGLAHDTYVVRIAVSNPFELFFVFDYQLDAPVELSVISGENRVVDVEVYLLYGGSTPLSPNYLPASHYVVDSYLSPVAKRTLNLAGEATQLTVYITPNMDAGFLDVTTLGVLVGNSVTPFNFSCPSSGFYARMTDKNWGLTFTPVQVLSGGTNPNYFYVDYLPKGRSWDVNIYHYSAGFNSFFSFLMNQAAVNKSGVVFGNYRSPVIRFSPQTLDGLSVGVEGSAFLYVEGGLDGTLTNEAVGVDDTCGGFISTGVYYFTTNDSSCLIHVTGADCALNSAQGKMTVNLHHSCGDGICSPPAENMTNCSDDCPLP